MLTSKVLVSCWVCRILHGFIKKNLCEFIYQNEFWWSALPVFWKDGQLLSWNRITENWCGHTWVFLLNPLVYATRLLFFYWRGEEARVVRYLCDRLWHCNEFYSGWQNVMRKRVLLWQNCQEGKRHRENGHNVSSIFFLQRGKTNENKI